jgi:hypothetical protein
VLKQAAGRPKSGCHSVSGFARRILEKFFEEKDLHIFIKLYKIRVFQNFFDSPA